MYFQVLLVVIILCCVYAYVTRSRKDLLLPPKLSGTWPVLGAAPMLIGDTKHLFKVLKFIATESLRNGGVVYAHIGPYLSYVLTDPDDCLTAANACLEKNFVYDLMKPWLGEGLISVTTDIPTWRRHRKIANKAFSQHMMDGFIGVFNSQAKRLVSDLAQYVGKGAFDHSVAIELRDLETIYKNALGVKEDEVDEFSNTNHVPAFQNLLHIIGHRFQNFWMYSDFLYSFTSLKRQQDEILKYLQSISRAIIKKRREALMKERSKISLVEERFKSYLDILLELPPEDAFTDKELQEEVDTMIVAGFDTSATIQSYALVLLGSYPECQEKAYRELQAIFDNSDRDVEKQDFAKLVYLEAVLKETLRLYPIAPILPRYVAEDVKLKNYTMPAGSNCFMVVYGLHRDPKLWGPDADEFKPERWLDPGRLPDNPNAFAGFSLGKRGCLGKQYALMSMKTALSHVLRRYKVYADYTKMEMQLDLLLKPATGCQIAIEKR